MSLSNLNVADVLLQEGDLPPEWQKGRLKHASAYFKNIQKPAVTLEQDLFREHPVVNGERLTGVVLIMLYEQPSELEQGWHDLLQSTMTLWARQGVGERAASSGGPDVAPYPTLLFRRCHALVYIGLNGLDSSYETADEPMVVAYGERLDRRLQSSVC